MSKIIALLPAHNEQEGIGAAIDGLRSQTCPPDRIIVIADNCTDETVQVARSLGAEVIETIGNTSKKAGALNQALAALLTELPGDDVILVQDADSALDAPFIENAIRKIAQGYGAVGGVLAGMNGIWWLLGAFALIAAGSALMRIVPRRQED